MKKVSASLVTEKALAASSRVDSHEKLNGLLEKVKIGDRQAFAEIYQLTAAKLLGVSLRILRNRGEAEEVLQDVFLTIWRQADQYDSQRAAAITWLTTLARNKTIDRARQRREAPLDGEETFIVDTAPTPPESAEMSQQRMKLDQCIRGLPPKHADAIVEAFYSGATYIELAARASVPLGTMKSWIRRSLILLKACLDR